MSPLKLNFLLFLFQCAESSSTSNSFYTSTDDSQNTSDDENLELTSTPNEKGKSPKDFCIMDEAIELGIAKVSSYGVRWWRWLDSEEYIINSFLPILPQRKKHKVPVGPLKKRNVGENSRQKRWDLLIFIEIY